MGLLQSREPPRTWDLIFMAISFFVLCVDVPSSMRMQAAVHQRYGWSTHGSASSASWHADRKYRWHLRCTPPEPPAPRRGNRTGTEPDGHSVPSYSSRGDLER